MIVIGELISNLR